MHLRLLATMEVKFRGLLQLAFFTTSLLSFADNGYPSDLEPSYAPLPDPGDQLKVVQRTLTATAKAVICKVSCIALQECQEAMGGVGYMDEPDEPDFNISRLYRDTAANMTWEGTTNVLSSEVLRHLVNDNNLGIFTAWMEQKVLGNIRDRQLAETLTTSWTHLRLKICEGKADLAAGLADGRQIMFSLAWVVCGALLAHDAQRDGDASAIEVAQRWILDGEGGGEYVLPEVAFASQRRSVDVKERLGWDCRLVWDRELPGDAALGYRVPVAKSKDVASEPVAKL